MSYLKFRLEGTSPSGLTKLWDVASTLSGLSLGVVKWHAPWRKYTFWPNDGCGFDSQCMSEISAFISNETRRHKES